MVLARLTVAATASALSYSRRPRIPTDQHRPEYLHLTVQRAGTALRVVWDRDSPAIRRATRAVLHIDDGAYHSDLGLVPSQLREGNLIYDPKSAEETLRLEVYSVEPSATGLVQVVNVSAAAVPAPSLPAVTSTFKPAPILTSVTPPVSHPAPKMNPVDPPVARPPPAGFDRAANNAPNPQTNPPPIAVEKPRSSSIPEMHADSTSDREPFVSVSTEPLMGSRFGHMVGKIPLLRRLGKPAKVAAPVPLSQVQPNLKKMPGNQRLDRAVSVDVKVNVAESGAVRHAEVVEYGDPPNWTLAAAALSAARRWTFEPARMEDTAVSSDVILHFRFGP